MTANPYPVPGVHIPTLRGRQKIVDVMIRHLTKPTPDHISVIGPQFIGKTVLLKGLWEHFSKERSQYATALYWDVRHGAPATDRDFYHAFAVRLQQAIEPVDPQLAGMLNENETNFQIETTSR